MIFRQSLVLECQIPRSSAKILAMQPEFNPRLREAALRRLFQLNYHFQLKSDALYSAVCYFDILLSSIAIPPNDFELFATACYWIATKLDTKFQLPVDKLNEFTGNSWSMEVFRTLELKIIEALGFQLSFPTVKQFVRTFLEQFSPNLTHYQVTHVLLEIALIEFKFVDVRPSMIAASAVAVSWAAMGNIGAAAEAVRASCCTNSILLAECMRTMVAFGERVAGAKEKSRAATVFHSLDFKFDVNSLLWYYSFHPETSGLAFCDGNMKAIPETAAQRQAWADDETGELGSPHQTSTRETEHSGIPTKETFRFDDPRLRSLFELPDALH
jgi:hypothetical protein